MLTINRTILAAALFMLAIPVAMAEDEAKQDAEAVEKGFAALDTDKDGSISRSEYETFTLAYIAKKRADFDKDIAALDTDKDDKISKDEASSNAALNVYFEALDFNSDGFLDKDELKTALKAAQEQEAQSSGG